MGAEVDSVFANPLCTREIPAMVTGSPVLVMGKRLDHLLCAALFSFPQFCKPCKNHTNWILFTFSRWCFLILFCVFFFSDVQELGVVVFKMSPHDSSGWSLKHTFNVFAEYLVSLNLQALVCLSLKTC